MTSTLLTEQLISDESKRKRFVEDVPDMLSFGIDMMVSSKQRSVLNSSDYFEYHYRRYLAGYCKTLHRVLFEVRRFVEADPNAAYHFIVDSLNRCKGELLDNEWYEVLARHKKSSVKILSAIPDLKQPAPAVFTLISTNRSLLRPIFM